MGRTDVPSGIALISLFWVDGVALFAWLNQAVLFDQRDHIADLLGDQRQTQVDLAVAQFQCLHLFGGDEGRIALILVHQRVGQLLPAAQEKVFFQLVKHHLILY
ncbi:hypothetical protein, partial [Anaerovibrio slackiae]|uniref:hypothetical protein n=1 Tax=Anaerovibrio slackiae TaxID=2652309 RepID=UPI00386901A2